MLTVPLMDAHHEVCKHVKTLRAQAEDPDTDPKTQLHLRQLVVSVSDLSIFFLIRVYI